jgi:hypothetical protein
MDRDLWLLAVHGQRLLSAEREKLKVIESVGQFRRVLERQKSALDRQAALEREMRSFAEHERRKTEMHERIAALMPALIKSITGSRT